MLFASAATASLLYSRMVWALQAISVDVSCATLLIRQNNPCPTACGASPVLLLNIANEVCPRGPSIPGTKLPSTPINIIELPLNLAASSMSGKLNTGFAAESPHSAAAVPVVSHALPLPGRRSPGRHHGVPCCSFSTPFCGWGHGSVRMNSGALAHSCAHTFACV